MSRWKPLLSASLVLASPAPAAAQCLLCTQENSAEQARAADIPLQVEVDTGLDFDRVAVAAPSGGQIVIDPVGRSRVVSGGLSDLGGMFMVGSVTIRGEPGRSVRVSLPDSVSLRGVGGSTASIARFTTDLPPAPRLGRDGTLRFSFGGRLLVTGEMDGDYQGRVAVTVDYQ